MSSRVQIPAIKIFSCLSKFITTEKAKELPIQEFYGYWYLRLCEPSFMYLLFHLATLKLSVKGFPGVTQQSRSK